MSPFEQQLWVECLGPTPSARLAVLIDLLRYSTGDRMSPDDRRIVVVWRDRLAQSLALAA